MAESTAAMTSAADRPQEFSMDEPEENEKKPFYKSTLFIVIAAIILLALLLCVIGTVLYFTVLKESDDYGTSETAAPSTDDGISQGSTVAPADATTTVGSTTVGTSTDVASSTPSAMPGQNAGNVVINKIDENMVPAVETKPGESD